MTNCIAGGVRKTTNYIGICKFTRRLIFKHGDYVNIISLCFQDIKTVQKKNDVYFFIYAIFFAFRTLSDKKQFKIKNAQILKFGRQ